MRPRRSGYLFVAPYFVLLVAVGIYPVGYAINLALTSFTAHFTGLRNFVDSFQNPEFVPALEHVAIFLAIWLTALVMLVVGLSLMLHSMHDRISAAYRFVLYLPAALAGSASVMLWLFMLQPGKSPWSFVLNWLGYHSLGDSLAPAHLPVVFALIAFWSGAGSWIVVMYGALATIPDERARIRTARRRRRVADRRPRQAAVDQEVDRVHGDRGVRRRFAAVRRA